MIPSRVYGILELMNMMKYMTGVGRAQRFHKTESGELLKPREALIDDEDESPRGILETLILGADSDQSTGSSSNGSRSAPSFVEKSMDEEPGEDTVPEMPSSRLQWRSLIDTLKRKSRRRWSTIPSLNGTELSRSLRRRISRIRCGSVEDAIDLDGFAVPKPSWRSFEFLELVAATDNFDSENLIGKGGHAEVYRGRLPDGEVVAVKKLVNEEDEEDERTADFLSELGIIAHINHANAARLIGFSVDNGLYLVLQLASNGSLSSVLHGSEESNLPWNIRFKVAVGVAEGLRYLHHVCPRRIIHRDIKASNILLTEDFEPQISDFGLAKWLPENWAQHIIFPIEGTFGYLSPEYFMHGIANEKSDVYAFGVLMLELMTGRRAVDSCRQSLVMWAKPLLDRQCAEGLVDPRLGEEYVASEMKRAMVTVSMCINHLPMRRPHMSRVVQLLRGEGVMGDLKQKSMAARAWMVDVCDVEDYTCNSYLNDLSRHRQLVLE